MKYHTAGGIIVFTMALLACCHSFGQFTLQGRVTTTDQESFAGVSIICGTKGTVSGVDGEFSLVIDPSDSVIIVMFVGYRTQRITIDKERPITYLAVTMEPETATFFEHYYYSYAKVTVGFYAGIPYSPIGMYAEKKLPAIRHRMNYYEFSGAVRVNNKSNYDWQASVKYSKVIVYDHYRLNSTVSIRKLNMLLSENQTISMKDYRLLLHHYINYARLSLSTGINHRELITNSEAFTKLGGVAGLNYYYRRLKANIGVQSDWYLQQAVYFKTYFNKQIKKDLNFQVAFEKIEQYREIQLQVTWTFW